MSARQDEYACYGISNGWQFFARIVGGILKFFLFLFLGSGRLDYGLHHGILISQLVLLNGLILWLRCLIVQKDIHRHECTVLLNHFPGPVLVAELGAVLVQI